MFNAISLWRERFGKTGKEMGRYLRYIFNGHLVIVFLFLLGTVAYYYQEWVKTLTTDFPAALIMAVIIGVFLTYSPIHTFLLEADKIFLLPLETRLSGYFNRSLIVSLALQVYVLLLVLAALMPMYAQVSEDGFRSFFLFLICLAGVKVLNLLIRWRIQYFIETSTHFIDSVVRYCMNTVFLYLLFADADPLFLVLIIGVMVLLLLFFQSQMTEKGLKWEYLIDLEEKRMSSFYRIANLFTDVPKLKDRIKRRRWLDWVINRIPYKHEKTFSHLFLRTFLRSGDYFGLFVRLTVIGGAVLAFISFGFGQLLFVLLFLYLTGFQLMPLWNHHENKLWVQLYPAAVSLKEQSFKMLLMGILLLQTVIFTATLFVKGEGLVAASSFLAGLLFSCFFVYVYSKKRLDI